MLLLLSYQPYKTPYLLFKQHKIPKIKTVTRTVYVNSGSGGGSTTEEPVDDKVKDVTFSSSGEIPINTNSEFEFGSISSSGKSIIVSMLGGVGGFYFDAKNNTFDNRKYSFGNNDTLAKGSFYSVENSIYVDLIFYTNRKKIYTYKVLTVDSKIDRITFTPIGGSSVTAESEKFVCSAFVVDGKGGYSNYAHAGEKLYVNTRTASECENKVVPHTVERLNRHAWLSAKFELIEKH